MEFKAFVVGDQRLVILRSLREMAGYSANESILDSCLEAYGHNISRDAVRTHLRWLEEQGLVSVEKIGECHSQNFTTDEQKAKKVRPKHQRMAFIHE